jgi:5-methylcytosine-specific restriction enzyme A
MPTQLTKNQFLEILQDQEITKPEDLAVFQAMYAFEGHKAYASQIGRILGVKSKHPASPINLQIGRLAKRLAKKHEVIFSTYENQVYYWDLFFKGWREDQYFAWQLKPNLVEALEELELTGKFLGPEEIPSQYLGKLSEGAIKTMSINAYERNPLARKLCIDHYGTICSVCNFDFEVKYGEIGKGFIHVHHLIPLAEIGATYEIYPIEDLRPVCPNCHSMLHREEEVLSIDELKHLFEQAKGKNVNYR